MGVEEFYLTNRPLVKWVFWKYFPPQYFLPLQKRLRPQPRLPRLPGELMMDLRKNASWSSNASERWAGKRIISLHLPRRIDRHLFGHMAAVHILMELGCTPHTITECTSQSYFCHYSDVKSRVCIRAAVVLSCSCLPLR